MKRVGFFGGTFDPPHQGHLILSRTAMRDMQLDVLLWVLTPQSPLKTVVFSTLDQRIEMVNLCIADEEGMALSYVDIAREPPFYTVDTARLIRQNYSQPIELFFIMGGDSLRNVVKWHRASELVFQKIDGLVVARRPGDDLDLDSLDTVMPGVLGRTHFIDMPKMAVSSYQIRNAIKEGKSVDLDLPPGVHQYIDKNHLYQTR